MLPATSFPQFESEAKVVLRRKHSVGEPSEPKLADELSVDAVYLEEPRIRTVPSVFLAAAFTVNNLLEVLPLGFGPADLNRKVMPFSTFTPSFSVFFYLELMKEGDLLLGENHSCCGWRRGDDHRARRRRVSRDGCGSRGTSTSSNTRGIG